MTVRTLKFTGYKMGSEPTEIAVTFDNLRVYSGPITNDQDHEFMSHNIIVPDVDISRVADNTTAKSIADITTTHTVSIRCNSGSFFMVNVRADALNHQDIPVVTDPTWFKQTFDIIHQPRVSLLDLEHRPAHEDPKCNVTLCRDLVPVASLDNDHQNLQQGIWHCEVPTNHTLHFDIMVRNLITFIN